MGPNNTSMALGPEWVYIDSDEELDRLIDDLIGENDDDESIDETLDADESEDER